MYEPTTSLESLVIDAGPSVTIVGLLLLFF